MTQAENAVTHRRMKTSLGHAWIVPRMEIIDTVPELLASGLPVFLEAEVPVLAALSPAARLTLWNGRLLALEAERTARATEPTRTVHWPWRDASDERPLAEVRA